MERARTHTAKALIPTAPLPSHGVEDYMHTFSSTPGINLERLLYPEDPYAQVVKDVLSKGLYRSLTPRQKFLFYTKIIWDYVYEKTLPGAYVESKRVDSTKQEVASKFGISYAMVLDAEGEIPFIENAEQSLHQRPFVNPLFIDDLKQMAALTLASRAQGNTSSVINELDIWVYRQTQTDDTLRKELARQVPNFIKDARMQQGLPPLRESSMESILDKLASIIPKMKTTSFTERRLARRRSLVKEMIAYKSQKEIAEELGISPPTVWADLKAIGHEFGNITRSTAASIRDYLLSQGNGTMDTWLTGQISIQNIADALGITVTQVEDALRDHRDETEINIPRVPKGAKEAWERQQKILRIQAMENESGRQLTHQEVEQEFGVSKSNAFRLLHDAHAI